MLLQMIDCKHTANILVHSDPVVSPENDRPASLAPDLIDYNMPLTTTYLKQMKLQCINNNERVNLILRSLVLTDHSSECWSVSDWYKERSLLLCGCSWAVKMYMLLLYELVHDWSIVYKVILFIKCFKKRLHCCTESHSSHLVSPCILFCELIWDHFEVCIIMRENELWLIRYLLYKSHHF